MQISPLIIEAFAIIFAELSTYVKSAAIPAPFPSFLVGVLTAMKIISDFLDIKFDNGNKYFPPTSFQISNINSANASHKHLLRDYYMASSYNSCCGGNSEKDFVDMVPLQKVIGRGARLLDFEIYSIDNNPVVAAGPEATTNGKFCLKGTYNSLSLKKVMQQVRMRAFSGGAGGAPNPDDPLVLSFRIKTNNGIARTIST